MPDRKSTRLNSSHLVISYAVFCLKKKKRICRPWHFHTPDPSRINTLSLHDALPISNGSLALKAFTGTNLNELTLLDSSLGLTQEAALTFWAEAGTEYQIALFAREPLTNARSEEHTSELQSPCNLVCRLLLEKKKTHMSSLALPHSRPISHQHSFPTRRSSDLQRQPGFEGVYRNKPQRANAAR